MITRTTEHLFISMLLWVISNLETIEQNFKDYI